MKRDVIFTGKQLRGWDDFLIRGWDSMIETSAVRGR